jgi:hypothetical protein
VRYADITYAIDRIRSVLIKSDSSNEDEYQIYINWKTWYTSRSSITFVTNRGNEVKRLLLLDIRQNRKRTYQRSSRRWIIHSFKNASIQGSYRVRILVEHRMLGICYSHPEEGKLNLPYQVCKYNRLLYEYQGTFARLTNTHTGIVIRTRDA